MPSKATAKRDFGAVFHGLRSILAKHEPHLVVLHNRPDHYYLDTHTIGTNKRAISFGGVRVGKTYVSYYLMPVYAGGLAGKISAALKRHMQGKACFNFKSVDDDLFAELDQLTCGCYEAWKGIGWVN